MFQIFCTHYHSTVKEGILQLALFRLGTSVMAAQCLTSPSHTLFDIYKQQYTLFAIIDIL